MQVFNVSKKRRPISDCSETAEKAGAQCRTGPGCYFVLAQGTGLVKIGHVQKVEKLDRRLLRMMTDCPYPLALQFVLSPATIQDERALHFRFQSLRHNGEWFHMRDELSEFLRFAIVAPELATSRMTEQIRSFVDRRTDLWLL